MKILIIDIDSLIPNLALEKIRKYHQDRGDTVEWNLPILKHAVDKVYVGCIFSKNRKQCDEWAGAEIGGTGYDLKKELPKEIDEVKPRINIGFTTRGCVRKCEFCVVPEKEGTIREVGDIYDLWDGKAKEIKLLDNNILAMPGHFKRVAAQIRKENLIVDFNQGLDIRLITDDLAKELKTLRHAKDIRFAFDSLADEAAVRKGVEILKRNNINSAMFYVLVGYNTTPDQDMYRLKIIKELRQRGYVMRHEKIAGQRWYNDLAAWVNQQWCFQSLEFDAFVKRRHAK